ILKFFSSSRALATIGAQKKFCSSGTGGGTTKARSSRSPRASAARRNFSQACLPRQFSSVIKTAAKVASPARPISPQRKSRQRQLVLGWSFISIFICSSRGNEAQHLLFAIRFTSVSAIHRHRVNRKS